LGELIRDFGLGTRIAQTVPNGRAFKNGEQPETHNAHRLTLKGESVRKMAAKRTGLDVKQDA
jgi:hypothetical protein